MFKVGDKIKVINPGRTYSTYENWVDQYAPEYKSKWRNGAAPTKMLIAKIVKGEFEDRYLIESENQVYIIGESGLEKINSFDKSNFKTGMIVTRRDGIKSIFLSGVCNCHKQENVFINLKDGLYMDFGDYNDDLKEKGGDSEFDIMKVEIPEYIGDSFRVKNEYDESEIIWQRDSAETLKLKAQQRELENKICQTRKELKAIQEKLEEVNESN